MGVSELIIKQNQSVEFHSALSTFEVFPFLKFQKDKIINNNNLLWSSSSHVSVERQRSLTADDGTLAGARQAPEVFAST